MDQHQPPHDDSAETAVVGAMLLAPAAAARGTELLTAEDLYRPANAAVFAAITAAVLAGEPTDPASIAVRLGANLNRTGGAPYLHDLIAAACPPASLAWHAHIVLEHAQRRRLIEAAHRIAQLGYDLERLPEDAAALAGKILAEVLGDRHRTDPVAWRDIIEPALTAIENASQAGDTPGITTGLTKLDQMTGGLRGGQLVVVAGRPSMGKSVLAVDWARRTAFDGGRPALLFSLEMSRGEIFNRVVSAESGTSLGRISRGRLSDSDWTAIARVIGRTESAPLLIDDSAPIHLPDIIARSRRAHSRTPLGLIVVDYLQLLTAGRRMDNREREVAEISRTLKLLAKELEVPVVAAAQVNRGPEQRADKRPMLSDLRESGAVEQDADIVVLLHRDDYYDARTARGKEIDLIVAKHRGGPVGTVVAIHDFAHARLTDIDAVTIFTDRIGDPDA